MDIFSAFRLKKPKEGRIVIIDAVRGLCIILMIAYHFAFDLVIFDIIPEGILYNPLLSVLQPFFAGVFIFVSGISSHFTRSNIKRGFIALGFSLAVSVVSFYAGEPILFGILHFIGLAAIIYGLLQNFLMKIRGLWFPVLCFFLFAVLYYLLIYKMSGLFDAPNLWIFGITDENFASSDYFPIFPWIFLFFAGTWFGEIVAGRKLPAWFYEFDIPFFPAAGRYTLIIYLVHQPVCMLLTRIILLIKGIFI